MAVFVKEKLIGDCQESVSPFLFKVKTKNRGTNEVQVQMFGFLFSRFQNLRLADSLTIKRVSPPPAPTSIVSSLCRVALSR